jgi:tetratricopeptide (TPR) repeat protein
LPFVKGGEKAGAESAAKSRPDPDDDVSLSPSGTFSLDAMSGPVPSEETGSDDRDLDGAPAADEHTAVTGAAMMRSAVPVLEGMVLADRYQIEAPLGEGGSGTVYRAWDRILGELVAVKILHPQRAREKSWIKRLAREVKVARAIRHPNVCRVFELGHADGHWFVTMELATGGSLRDLLHGLMTPPRPLADRLRDIRELCAGLGAMHAVAITHRDVTPRNVLRMADGRLVLTDFGLAIEHDDQTTVHGGTPAYMPPEAARGERSDQRSDVFQLGMIMHEVLTGVRPTWTPDGARLQLVEPPIGASAVEEELALLVADCVNTDPARRPPSALAVAGRLAAAEMARPAPFPIRVFTRARRSARRHPRLMAIAGAVAALAIVVRSVQVLSRPPLCRGAAQQMAGIWDPSRSEAVRRAFEASGKSYAGETFSRVRPILDDYAGAWTRMYTDACEATHLRGEQSAEVLDLRMACLKNSQGELRALTDLFSVADGDVVSRSINAASAVTPLARCADIPVLKAVVRPPDDRETRSRVEELRQRLSEIKALYGAGRFVESKTRALPLVVSARALGYEPVLAEVLDTLGRVERWTGPFPQAEASLDEAMLVAEASRHDRLLAEAAVDKASLLAYLGRGADLDRLVPRAEAILKRIGGDRRLQSWIYTSTGYVVFEKGGSAESLAIYQKALQAKLDVLPADHWDVALTLGSIANSLHSLGRESEALQQNGRAIAILERALGSRHPDLALHIYNRGEIRLALGQIAQARTDFERSLEIWTAELPTNHLYNSYALTGIGLCLLAQGEAVADAIVPLQRALTIRELADAPATLRAQTMFALAQALWLAGTDRIVDRARAVRLAEAARDLFPADKLQERGKIDAALASWRQASPEPDGAPPHPRPRRPEAARRP